MIQLFLIICILALCIHYWFIVLPLCALLTWWTWMLRQELKS